MNPRQIDRQHRQKDDMRMTEYFPVSFTHDADRYSAELTNLSATGAHLLVKNYEPVRHILVVGEELTLEIRTPYGKSECMARVAWLAPDATPVSVGLEFVSISKDASDPLRCAIDSAL